MKEFSFKEDSLEEDQLFKQTNQLYQIGFSSNSYEYGGNSRLQTINKNTNIPLKGNDQYFTQRYNKINNQHSKVNKNFNKHLLFDQKKHYNLYTMNNQNYQSQKARELKKQIDYHTHIEKTDKQTERQTLRSSTKQDIISKYQPRLQSIQRMNSKIKFILNKNQNQTKESKRQIPIQKQSIKSLNQTKDLNHTNLTQFDISRYQGKQIHQSKQKIHSNKQNNQNKPTIHISIKRSQNQRVKQNSKPKRYLNSVKKQLKMCTLLNYQSLEKKIQTKRQQKGRNDKQNKRSQNLSKNVDNQIQKIERKIRQCEEEKTKLNIQFKPYNFGHYERSANRKRVNTQQTRFHNFSNAVKDNQVKFIQQSTKIQKPPLPKRNKTQFREEQTGINLKGISEFKLKQNYTSKKNQIQEPLLSKQFLMGIIDKQIRKTMIDGIEERKNRLKSSNISLCFSSTNEIKRLARLLAQQVQLDQRLRNGKIWLEISHHTNKWSKLTAQLALFKIFKDQATVEAQFTPSLQENNPFFTLTNCDETFQSLSYNYKSCQQHWSSNIEGAFRKSQLSLGNFYNKCIDLQKKGHFVLEDLVRFLNMETGKFFRNRDLHSIFRRFSQSQKGDYQSLIKVLCP